MFEELQLTAEDGVQIVARLFTPASHPRGSVLIAPAMGVAQRFYEPFANWLRSRGFLALTFDYRGVGLSRRGPLRGFEADVFTWARQDANAAAAALLRIAPAVPLTWIGHSLGAQIIPLVPNASRASKLITVAAGSGYWRENVPELRRKVWLLWYFLVPPLVAAFGYFPGARLGMVGDLPAGVMKQWRRWCMNPDYAPGAEGSEVRALFAAVNAPLTSFSFTDDEMMSKENIDSLHGFFTHAMQKPVRLSPSQLETSRIGHFGFFRPELRQPLWEKLVERELSVAA